MFIVISSIVTGFFLVLLYKIWNRKIYIWFPSYVKDVFFRPRPEEIEGKPKHIIFLFVDHFEAPLEERMIGRRRISQWLKKYPEIASKYKDSDGVCPQHTWFYASEKFDIDYKQGEQELETISNLCSKGFGEIEFHIHHHNDTSTSLNDKIEKGIDIFNKFGALITAEDEPKKAFGFIHGGWALDNSIKGKCGVNNELQVLKEAGCYADFTFPAYSFTAQPRKINSIYYAIDDPDKPKSYDTGVDVKVGKKPTGDLMIFEGLLTIDWKDWRHIFYPKIEYGDISQGDPPNPSRIDQWIRCNIHVKGRPEWIFVKIYCQGCYDSTMEVVLGKRIDEMFTYLEDKYNDGVNYKLHYVTARQAYNIIKAAEDGKTGDPAAYRDYLIKPYRNSNRVTKEYMK